MSALSDVLDRLPDGAGPIGLLSGDEFTPATAEFDRRLLAAARGPRVALLTCADPTNAERNAVLARAHFEALGARAFALDADPLPDALPAFDVLYIGGGDPSVLLATLRDDPGWAVILQAWRDGAALAGASAGAMALCARCLVPEPGATKPTVWEHGLGPVARVGLAVHAATRPRAWLRAVTESSHLPVLALDDATGVLITARDEPVVIGHGRARVLSAGSHAS